MCVDIVLMFYKCVYDDINDQSVMGRPTRMLWRPTWMLSLRSCSFKTANVLRHRWQTYSNRAVIFVAVLSIKLASTESTLESRQHRSLLFMQSVRHSSNSYSW